MNINLKTRELFQFRHIGPSAQEINDMLEATNNDSVADLVNETIPSNIQSLQELKIEEAIPEYDFLKRFKAFANQNLEYKSFIGLGYHNCIVPQVIQRNILENPGWYTAYTPYQAEISQGRLEALINFQTMVIDLTAMEVANASLLDEATAAAEAMAMLFAARKGNKKKANVFLVDEEIFPQTQAVLYTRSEPIGIKIIPGNIFDMDLTNQDVFGIMVQNPDNNGEIKDYGRLFTSTKELGIQIACIADLLSLTLIQPPGEIGADVVVGSTQRFGIPLGYGGPHAAYFATKESYKRHIPGRIIGLSKDKDNKPAFRMALQTREQHIKRERATSNICTAQVLLAVMAGMYAVYHGATGLKNIAMRIHALAVSLKDALEKIGVEISSASFFDTLKIKLDGKKVGALRELALKNNVNFRYFEDGSVGITLDESNDLSDLMLIASIFEEVINESFSTVKVKDEIDQDELKLPKALLRTSDFMTHKVFENYHTEHELLRYIKRLENKDLSLVHSMISLGSCTMKLNASTEMVPLSWSGFSNIHPYAPLDQALGYKALTGKLENWLCEITGFDAVSFQPNSGAQGEYTGLMVIRAYHHNNGDLNRNVALIPSSAHGTNPASAVMAGMKVIIIKCDEYGNIDMMDLKEKAEKNSNNLAALMVTYPSTHGVFEDKIKSICELIHSHRGQVYMDGANLNAQVGLTNPALIGADVCHLNLHKTFCIPHGGGGPGMGPIGVKDHLKAFLPGNPLLNQDWGKSITPVAAAHWGSASILTISYAYIALMGAKGLKNASEIAILNANYLKEVLKSHYKILYTGNNNRVAHEFIIDCREFRNAGIEVEDIAKRLMDYGFHAPTVSFPVPGTMMIEPTESESKSELDRFCEAMISIREEIKEIESEIYAQDNNVLKNAPHTHETLCSDHWDYPYSREKAAYPLSFVKENKFWPSVSRIDNAYGDRHLFCSCVPADSYEESTLETV